MLRRLFFVLIVAVSLLGLPLLSAHAGGAPGTTGVWLETWDDEAVDYCPDPNYYVVPRNEPLITTLLAYMTVLIVDYQFFAGDNLVFGRSLQGNFIFAEVTSDWIHHIEAVPYGPTAYRVTSTFYRTDGSCVISNSAWWVQATSADICTAWAFQDGNRRAGHGVQYQIVGNILRNEWLQAIGKGYAPDGTPWYWLSDGTWVSSKVAVGVGNCNF